jgi:CheY-like chemotaxis protein/anti-sigma regulatory factor (Ser/Thr protein kinase)
MEEEIRKAEHLEALGLLAGGIAHDFNNLLAGIFGYMGLARGFAKNNKDIKDNLDKAMVVFNQAKSLTQQLLTFSKGGAPVRRLASVSELLKDVASFVLSGTSVRPELLLPPDLWACEVDAGQLSEVFNNILINAQQAMPGGGVVTVAAENVRIPDEGRLPLKKGDYVKVAVHDTGIGIAKQNLTKIFDPFFTTKEKGSGLGLAIAYSIIRKHEGHIEISSEPGAGTTVTIHLPASGMQADRAAPQNGAIPRGRGRVLVMDDEAFLLDAMSSVLASLGYTVETSPDGKEAIRRYEDAKKSGAPFDAVILDLTIPGGFGGKHVLAEILEIDASVKAIATSGYSDDPVMSNPQDFGFRAAVRKPYTLEELGQTLYGVISGK